MNPYTEPAPRLEPAPWTAEALCAGKADRNYDPWFEEKSPLAAKRICYRCPVATECAAQALADDERYGVWGGLAIEDRARQVEA